MKLSLTIKLLLCATLSFAQSTTTHFIKVNFLYGSKPLRSYKATEPKYFGGLHGGHVTIQVDDEDYGFRRTTHRAHIFARKERASEFVSRTLNGGSRYSADRKTVTFIIPITDRQYIALQDIHTSYCESTPYDYAFFGMRCAAATQDILGKIGVLKSRSRFGNIATAFYPKRLRKRVFRLARKNNYEMISTPGRPTRRWERD